MVVSCAPTWPLSCSSESWSPRHCRQSSQVYPPPPPPPPARAPSILNPNNYNHGYRVWTYTIGLCDLFGLLRLLHRLISFVHGVRRYNDMVGATETRARSFTSAAGRLCWAFSGDVVIITSSEIERARGQRNERKKKDGLRTMRARW
ncbi:hypothetical protein TruAng_004430 [Truncatella angustata]|nr:hypothetical protein TruAng_004430 [Truncatella angustata]